MTFKLDKKVFTFREGFYLGLKRIKGDKTAAVSTFSVVALGSALAEIALLNSLVWRVIEGTYGLQFGGVSHGSFVNTVLFFVVVVMGLAAYIRVEDSRSDFRVMVVCGASVDQILRICLAEALIIGLVGAASGVFGSLLIWLLIYGSQFGWPVWLLALIMDGLASFLIVVLVVVLVVVSSYLVFSFLSLRRSWS